MQKSRQGTKADHSENLVHDLGTFTATKVNLIWFLTLILKLKVSFFYMVKGTRSVIPLRYQAPLIGMRPYPGTLGT